MKRAVTTQSEYGRKLLVREQIANKDKDSLRCILGTEEGRWFISRLLDNTFIYSKTFVGDSCQTAYNEGKRAVGLNVLEKVLSLGEAGMNAKQQAEREYRAFNELLDMLTQQTTEGEE